MNRYFKRTGYSVLLLFVLGLIIVITMQPAQEVKADTVLTITGSFEYQDRNGSPVPASNYLVDLYKIVGSVSVKITDGYTNSSGQYTFQLTEYPGNVYIYVQIYSASTNDIMVLHNASELYYCPTTLLLLDGGDSAPINPVTISDTDILDAFWIKSDLQYACDTRNPPGSYIAEWEYNWAQTSVFSNGTIKIGMHDAEYVPDIVLHEMGHNVMFNVYKYIPSHPYGDDGKHYVFYNETPETAWVEGWADYWSLIVNNDDGTFYIPDYPYLPKQYPLELATWDHIDQYDPPNAPEYYTTDGDTVEGRVAGALWDIYDSVDDNYYVNDDLVLLSFDTYDGNFSEIWNVFTDPEKKADTFEEFWGYLKSVVSSEYSAVRSIFQNTIDYDDLMVAETEFHQGEDAGRYIFVSVNITSVEADEVELPGVEIRSYEAEMDYSSSGIEIRRVEGGEVPYDDPDESIGASITTFEQSVTEDITTPLVARVYPVLTGSCLVEYDLDLDFSTIESDSNPNISDGDGYSQTYRRGDVNDDDEINIVDAFICAKIYLNKMPLDQFNAVNAASPVHDGVSGDRVAMSDAYAIANYYLNHFNEYFQPVTKVTFEKLPADEIQVVAGKPDILNETKFVVPVIVQGIPSGSSGIGAYAFKIHFNPGQQKIIGVLPGKASFSLEPLYVLDNRKGELLMAGLHPGSRGATGDIIVGYLVVASDTLSPKTFKPEITIMELVDGLARDIVLDGRAVDTIDNNLKN